MLERLKLWWHYKLVRGCVQNYFFHMAERDEWDNRYDGEDEKAIKKQNYYVVKHTEEMKTYVNMLLYRYKIPKNKWVPVGEHQEVLLLDFGMGVPLDKQVRRRWNT